VKRENVKVESLKRRLGSADTTQIRLLLQLSPAQRLRTMLSMQTTILTDWHTRLRRTHPHLSDLELCELLFERLQKNG